MRQQWESQKGVKAVTQSICQQQTEVMSHAMWPTSPQNKQTKSWQDCDSCPVCGMQSALETHSSLLCQSVMLDMLPFWRGTKTRWQWQQSEPLQAPSKAQCFLVWSENRPLWLAQTQMTQTVWSADTIYLHGLWPQRGVPLICQSQTAKWKIKGLGHW